MFFLMYIVDVFMLFSFLIACRAFYGYRKRRGLAYPPGPPGWPIIGNLLDVPPTFTWLAYTEFSKKYGKIVYYRVLGNDIVVLNTIETIKDLLEKHGDIYSDRPDFPVVSMMDWHWQLPLTRYGEDWRQKRNLLDRSLRPGAAATYRPMQQARAHVLLSRLLATPNEWKDHVEHFQGELILDMTYGYEVKGRHDKKLVISKRLNDFAITMYFPGALLVNELPFLRHIPAWVPYISYQPLTQIGRNLSRELLDGSQPFVKESIASGTARPSLALEHLQEMEKLNAPDRNEAEKTLSNALGSIYVAGADTTVSSMMTLLVACLLHPEVQKRAQDEIDTAVGRERLPTFEDRPKLPFVDAMCKEVLRWRPATPLAFPHSALEDGVYEGFFIPKGTILVGNMWGIFHDPSIYPEPDVYKPERFLNPDGSLRDDPVLLSAAFGFGKRVCPGRHFVDATMFIFAASLLSVFRIDNVQEKKREYKYSGAILSAPEPFACSIIPMDRKAEELIIADAMAGAQ